MNIAELLEKALEECNWDFVSDVYEMMTGKRIEPPAPDDVFDMLCNISDKIANIEYSLSTENKEPVKVKKQSKTTRKKQSTAKKTENKTDFSVASSKPSRKISGENRENKFEQMTDAIYEAEKENGYDQINDNVKPTSRKRNSYSDKSVTCIECSKTFNVHPMFARSNYTCDRCLGKRG
jgi:hypothetical protein